MLLKDTNQAKAMEYARRADTVAPNQPSSMDTLAVIQMSADRFDEAVVLLRRSVDGVPDAPSLRFHLAQALAGKGDVEAARAELEKIIAGNQPFPERKAAEKLLIELR